MNAAAQSRNRDCRVSSPFLLLSKSSHATSPTTLKERNSFIRHFPHSVMPRLSPPPAGRKSGSPAALRLKPQEIPFTDPASNCFFRPSADKPFLATPAALDVYGEDEILRCLGYLRGQAEIHSGLDYLQVFECPGKPEPLWFIEDGPGGAITALLASDY